MSEKKVFVLDTNIFLSDSNCLKSFGDNDIVVPFQVVQELDSKKDSKDAIGFNARHSIRQFDKLRKKGDLEEGVTLDEGDVNISFIGHSVTEETLKEYNLPADTPDNRIIATILNYEKEQDCPVILVTNDVNMRVMANIFGIESQEYNNSKVVTDTDEIYTGTTERYVTQDVFEKIFDESTSALSISNYIRDLDYDCGLDDLNPNEFVTFRDAENESSSSLARFINKEKGFKFNFYNQDAYNIRPRNREQRYALDLLFDNDVRVVTLVGQAGTGKTLLATAAALEQSNSVHDTMANSDRERKSYAHDKKFDNYDFERTEKPFERVVISRPVEPMGKDIGYLPGTMEEKMSPWLSPIKDNLEYILGSKMTVDTMMERGIIEVEALTYIRGRSISNSFIIIDEAQNLTHHEIKTILTRVGEGSKVVLTGDIKQIDNTYIDETSNGLTHVVEKFREQEIGGHVTLTKGERSKVASISADIL